MRKTTCLVPVFFLLAACAAGPAGAPAGQPATLHSPAIPWAEIGSLLDSGQRGTLANLESTGYVILDGWIGEDGHISVRRVVQSYPDHVRDSLAAVYAESATVAVQSSGSQIRPAAEIFVVFYRNKMEGNLALTFARKRGAVGADAGSYLDIVRF